MLVRTGSIDFSVPGPDLEGLGAAVEGVVAAAPGAFVESSSSQGGYLDERRYGPGVRAGQSRRLTVRVPVAQFFDLRDAIK